MIMRSRLDALPAAARAELRRMFLAYRAEVSKRLEQGWEAGAIDDAVIEDVDQPFLPARQLEDAVAARRKEEADLRATLAKTSRDDPEYGRLLARIRAKAAERAALEKRLRRDKGICRDWSDDVWSVFAGMDLQYWSVRDQRRGARPYHTAAVACSPPDSDSTAACLAFDPWWTGLPDVFAFDTWDAKTDGGRLPPDYFLHDLPEKAP
jgi:hypothetical protein